MDRVAYNEKTGGTYVVNVSPRGLGEEERRILIKKFKQERLTDSQIYQRLEDIANMVMDAEIAKAHPNPEIRKVAGSHDLTDEEKEDIYAMTHQTGLPVLGFNIFDSDNANYSNQDRLSSSLSSIGMHEISPNSFKMRLVSRGTSLNEYDAFKEEFINK